MEARVYIFENSPSHVIAVYLDNGRPNLVTIAHPTLLFTAKDKICSLDDDIQDFIALFPTDDYTAIVKDYLKNDAEFKRSQEYIASLEFAEIFDRASGSPRYKAVEKFLKKAGHNGVVEMMRYGPPQPKKSAHPRSGNGTRAMHDDFIRILPHDKIKALFDKKMNDSSAFQHFVRSVQSEQFQVSPALFPYELIATGSGFVPSPVAWR
uniref:Uncharacterized protein n=1 Tax=Timema poppense TaxID=170557 RepID=A0A7R9D5R6_TIMPO|nr:unnamed protein product [Timema poppensis]